MIPVIPGYDSGHAPKQTIIIIKSSWLDEKWLMLATIAMLGGVFAFILAPIFI